MPNVPYQPVPDVRPAAPPTPSLRVDTPGAAFGTNVAQAISSVGGDISRDGDEIFQRAMALQDLSNRTSADQANTNFVTALGQRHAEWQSLRGQQSVQGYPQYQQDAHDLREQFGANLNPMARKLYDTDSRSQLARTLFSAAGHMGEENVKWQLGSADSALKANRQQSYNMPEDEASFQKRLDAVHNQMASVGQLQGWDANETSVNEFNQRSALWMDRIKGLSQSKPLLAMKMLEANKADLTTTDYDSAYRVLHPQVVSTVSRTGAQSIMQGWDPRMDPGAISRGMSIQEPLRRIVQRAQQDHPELRFTIPSLGGARTQEEQNALVAKGTSHTYHSNHLEGRAVDLAPVDANGQINFNDRATYGKIQDAMYQASNELGIPLSGEHDKIKSWDPGHYSIDPMPGYQPVTPQTDETLAEKRQRGRAWAGEQFPNNEALQTDVRDALDMRLNSQWHTNLADQRDLDFRNRSAVESGILGLGLEQGQKIPTNVDELRAISPEMQQAYDNLPNDQKARVLSSLAKNAKQDYPMTQQNFQTFTQLKGEAENDPAAFLNRDVVDMELPRAWRSQLLQLQIAKNKSADKDPSVTHAMQQIGPMIPQEIRQDKQRYNTFIGTLQDEIREFQHQNKRQPNFEDYQQIGSRLLTNMNTHWYQLGSNYVFESPVPDGEATKIRETALKRKGVALTDTQVQRLWVAQQYQKLFGTSKPNQPAGP